MFESGWMFLGWIVCTWLIASVFLGIHDALKEVNDDLESKLMKRINDIVHRVRVEKHNDVYYWYDSDDGEFLAQGTTDEEIINLLKARFPQHVFYLPTNHLICAKHDWKPVLAPLTKNP